jgi:hypothetical protein
VRLGCAPVGAPNVEPLEDPAPFSVGAVDQQVTVELEDIEGHDAQASPWIRGTSTAEPQGREVGHTVGIEGDDLPVQQHSADTVWPRPSSSGYRLVMS